jgi:hypothetical protein
MTLGLSLQSEPADIWGTKIPNFARVEAVIISVSQQCCRGCAGVILTSGPVKNLFCRLFQYDRPSWEDLRLGVDAALRHLPKYEPTGWRLEDL